MTSYFLICNRNVICNGKKWQQVPTTHNHPHGMHQLTMFTRKLIQHTSHREQVSPSYISGGLSTYIFSVSVFLHGWKASASKGKSRSDNAKLKAHPAQELHKPTRMVVVGAEKGKKARISAASARAHTRNTPSQSRSSSFSTAGSFLCFSLPIHPPIFLGFFLCPVFCSLRGIPRIEVVLGGHQIRSLEEKGMPSMGVIFLGGGRNFGLASASATFGSCSKLGVQEYHSTSIQAAE